MKMPRMSQTKSQSSPTRNCGRNGSSGSRSAKKSLHQDKRIRLRQGTTPPIGARTILCQKLYEPREVQLPAQQVKRTQGALISKLRKKLNRTPTNTESDRQEQTFGDSATILEFRSHQ